MVHVHGERAAFTVHRQRCVAPLRALRRIRAMVIPAVALYQGYSCHLLPSAWSVLHVFSLCSCPLPLTLLGLYFCSHRKQQRPFF